LCGCQPRLMEAGTIVANSVCIKICIDRH
jgi:hypothetical protein